MATPLTGANGQVTFGGGAVVILKQWELDDTADFEDTTGMAVAATGRRSKTVTLTDWKGSFEGTLCSDEAKFKGATPAIRSGSTGTGTFVTGGTAAGVATGALTYSGPIIVTSCKMTSKVDGVATFSVSFEGNGTLSYPT